MSLALLALLSFRRGGLTTSPSSSSQLSDISTPRLRSTAAPYWAQRRSMSSGTTEGSNPDDVSPAAAARLVYGRDDALFGCIEKQQGCIPFGSVLDAGTGLHSLRWIATLRAKGLTDFCAITADATMQRNCQLEIEALGVADQGTIVIGNWFPSSSAPVAPTVDPEIDEVVDTSPPVEIDFPYESFDVILADYLIGAMDGFSPYQQDLMLPKLVSYLKPGGRLYIVGLEPIPDTVPETANSVSSIIVRVRQVRDACILLAGHRCYREYPVEWVHRQIAMLRTETASTPTQMVLKHTKQFPILYRHSTILKQIGVGRSKLPLMRPEMQLAMGKLLDELEAESLQATRQSPTGRLQFGFDYVVTAEKELL